MSDGGSVTEGWWGVVTVEVGVADILFNLYLLGLAAEGQTNCDHISWGIEETRDIREMNPSESH